MKKLFTLIASVTCAFASAQSLQMIDVDNSTTITNGGAVYVGASASNTVVTTINVKNISSSSKTYKVVRTKLSMNSGAGTYFCFAGNCFPPTTYSASCTLAAGQDAQSSAGGPLQADFYDGPSSGMSDVKYTFTNTSDPTDTAVVIIRYNNPLGIQSLNEEFNSVSDVFPNPAKEKAYVTVTSNNSMEASMTIYNSLGSAVSTRQVSIVSGKNNISLNTENLNSGIYFMTLTNGKNKVIKKFVVN